MNDKDIVTAAFDLAKTANLRVEEHHSFRHRGLGMVAAAALLVPSLWFLVKVVLAGNWAVLGTHIGVAMCFGLFFGALVLYEVVGSRRIPWLRLRHNGAEKMIPLPGVYKDEMEAFLGSRLL